MAIVVGSIVAVLVVVGLVAVIVVLVLRRRTAARPTAVGLPEVAGVAPPKLAPVPPVSAVPSVPSARPGVTTSDSGTIVFDARPARARHREELPPIRRAEPSDEPRLAEIEAQSDPGLSGAGLGALPAPALREGDEPASVLLVAGRPAVAYIRIDEVDGVAHIDQLAVLPSVARQGIGRALLDAAIAWAARNGYQAMTLSTFAESEWNARVYDPTGFTPVASLSPGLRELRDWERAIGLDALGARVVMRRDLSA